MPKNKLIGKKVFYWKLKQARIHHKVFFTLIGTIGVVLIWRGIWNIFDTLPFINEPILDVGLGFLFVIASGIFFRLI